jgi:acyl-CoA synthetase (AMP-forming)/AMP-acid ligase II
VSKRAPFALRIERRADGVLLLSADRAFARDYPLPIDDLRHAAERRPRAPFRAQRLSHAEAWARTGAIASWLIAQGYGPESARAAILSGDSLEQTLFRLGAARAGLAVALLSPGDSPSDDPGRLGEALDLVQPTLVFAQDFGERARMLDRAAMGGALIVTVDGRRGLAYGALANCPIDAAVAERRLHITADTPACILFALDSAGVLKAVVNTHGNLAAAAAMKRAARALLGTDAGAAVWGMAETAGAGFARGLPLPGLCAKLVPMADRYELRVKGPNVTPGYYRNAEATHAAFDQAGFFKTGHAVRWIEPATPERGLAFDAVSARLQSG